MIVKKLDAGALQFTMYVVVVIALLLGGFIILLHTHKHFKVQTGFTLEVIKNCDKGLLYALQNTSKSSDTMELDIFKESFKSLKVHSDYWGVFEKVTSVSIINNKIFKKIALVGGTQPKKERTALYLEDQNRPLVVVGNTKIQGLAYLPSQGIRTGNISGHSYYGNALIYGDTKQSNQLPKILNTLQGEIRKIPFKYKITEGVQFVDLVRNKKIENSFYNPTKLLYNTNPIELFDVTLTGHIVVQSDSKIIVHRQSKLKDVLLIAPQIDIKSNVKGVFQAFATKEIKIGKNCELDYPSTLVLNNSEIHSYPKSDTSNSVAIEISKGSSVKGTIIFLGNEKQHHPQIKIKDRATISGEVFCDRNIELLGKVYGSVFTSGFVAAQSGSMYQNHIYNGQILVDGLPEQYVGLSFQNSKKDVAKWLY